MFQLYNEGADLVALALIEHVAAGNFDGPLSGAKVALLTGPIPTDATTLFSQLTEAAFTGYAKSAALVWGTPYINPTGQYEVTAAGVQFVMTDTVAPETITGAALISGTTAPFKLIACDVFQTPINLAQANQGFTYDPSVSIPISAWGAGSEL